MLKLYKKVMMVRKQLRFTWSILCIASAFSDLSTLPCSSDFLVSPSQCKCLGDRITNKNCPPQDGQVLCVQSPYKLEEPWKEINANWSIVTPLSYNGCLPENSFSDCGEGPDTDFYLDIFPKNSVNNDDDRLPIRKCYVDPIPLPYCNYCNCHDGNHTGRAEIFQSGPPMSIPQTNCSDDPFHGNIGPTILCEVEEAGEHKCFDGEVCNNIRTGFWINKVFNPNAPSMIGDRTLHKCIARPPPPSHFEAEVTNAKKYQAGTAFTGLMPKFCCSDFYLEPTNFNTYSLDIQTNKKMSCSAPVKTDKCGTIVPTRNSHGLGDFGSGVHCIESHSCLECIEHFQILCGPGYTWDGYRCEWLIDIPHALKYDQGNDIKGSHGATSCIVLDQNGYAINTKYNNPNKDDCASGYCYNALDNVDYNGGGPSMIGETEFARMGITWTGSATGATRPPTIGQPTNPPSPTPPPTSWKDLYTPVGNVSHNRLRILLADGFCCGRMFEPGIIGKPKEIFLEGKEFLPGHDTNSHMINMGIADGSLSLGRRRLAYKGSEEIPTFSETFFGGHIGCGHSPPVNTQCGLVVDPHGLDLHDTSMTQYLGGTHCGHTGGVNKCHDEVKDSITGFGDTFPFDDENNPYTPNLFIEGGGNYFKTFGAFITSLGPSMNLKAAMMHYQEEYITTCVGKKGCGFHSDCTSRCHKEANYVYTRPFGCISCPLDSNQTFCLVPKGKSKDILHGGLGGCDDGAVYTDYYPYQCGFEPDHCVEYNLPEWDPTYSTCTSPEQYVPPRGHYNYQSPDHLTLSQTHGGSPHLSFLFSKLSNVKMVTDDCMCSIDGAQKADIDHEACHMCLDASVIACADGTSYNSAKDKCTTDAPNLCKNAFDECHVQPEDQLYADPIPCLRVSGHNFADGSEPWHTDKEICESQNYTVPRACVWDKKKQKCKAGIYFGSYNAIFQNTCDSINFQNLNEGPVQTEWNCESTVWNEKRPCQSSKRVAYPVECERKYGGGKIECDPARRVIPWSPDPDDICSVLYGHKNSSFLGPNLDKDQVMKALGHLCEWPEKSFLDKLEDWLTNLSPMELVAFGFLGLPAVGTLVCMGNSIFRWNEGCLKKCCHRNFDKKSTWKRTQVANTITAGRVIVVDPSQDSKKY